MQCADGSQLTLQYVINATGNQKIATLIVYISYYLIMLPI